MITESDDRQSSRWNTQAQGLPLSARRRYFAGKLIMDAGLAGYRVGDAAVSDKHCGFVVNLGKATATDVRGLMHDVSDRVYAQFGVHLEPEVRFVGNF